jgi:hypothetical protein
MTTFSGEDIEKCLWIKSKKTFLLKLVRQRITLGDRRKSSFDFLLFREVCRCSRFTWKWILRSKTFVKFLHRRKFYASSNLNNSPLPHIQFFNCVWGSVRRDQFFLVTVTSRSRQSDHSHGHGHGP